MTASKATAGMTLCSVVLLGSMAGCSTDDRKGTLQPAMVRGVVTLNGRSIERGAVTFIPSGPREEFGDPGVARIDPDGSFWVGNANLTKPAGLRPGRYRVTIVSMKPRPDGPSGPIAKLDIPERYSEEETTPFEVTVNDGQNKFRFDMVTDSSAHAEQEGANR